MILIISVLHCLFIYFTRYTIKTYLKIWIAFSKYSLSRLKIILFKKIYDDLENIFNYYLNFSKTNFNKIFGMVKNAPSFFSDKKLN